MFRRAVILLLPITAVLLGMIETERRYRELQALQARRRVASAQQVQHDAHRKRMATIKVENALAVQKQQQVGNLLLVRGGGVGAGGIVPEVQLDASLFVEQLFLTRVHRLMAFTQKGIVVRFLIFAWVPT